MKRIPAAIQATADAAGVDVRLLYGRSRIKGTARVRFAACLLAFQGEGDYSAIARALERDHTTIMSAVERGRLLMQSDPEFVALVEKARALMPDLLDPWLRPREPDAPPLRMHFPETPRRPAEPDLPDALPRPCIAGRVVAGRVWRRAA